MDKGEIKANKTDFPYKVELHVHLDGALRYKTIFDIARKRGIQLPVNTAEKLHDFLVVKTTMHLDKVLEGFNTFIPVVAGDRDSVYRIAYEFCETCAENNIQYVEARYSPHVLANTFEKPYYALESGNYSPRDVVTTITEAFNQGCGDFGVNVKSILCCLRDKSEWSIEVSQLCRDFKKDGVVAIDIAGPEYLSKDPKNCPHKLAFLDAERNGIHRTAHAGEVTRAETVLEALDELHSERIGHGYSCLENLELYGRVKREQIHLETCPISSIITGGAPTGKINHPIIRFAEDKMNFSINTDDPTVLGNTLCDDYKVAMEIGLTKEQVVQSIFNAARSSFTTDKEKAKLVDELTNIYGPH